MSLGYLKSVLNSIMATPPATEDRSEPDLVPFERATSETAIHDAIVALAEGARRSTFTPADPEKPSPPPSYLSTEMEEEVHVEEHQDEFGGIKLSVEVVAQRMKGWDIVKMQEQDRNMDQGLRMMGL